MYNLATEAGFRVQRWPLVWIKTHPCINQANRYNFTKNIEFAMVCRKPTAVLAKGAPTCVVEASNMDARKEFNHPFVKPYAIWAFIAEHVSTEGQLILEPFAGRGSGVISLLKMKRQVVGVEINEAHYNALLENVKKYYLTLNPRFILS